MMKSHWMVSIAATTLLACGAQPTDEPSAPTTEDGTAKQIDGKADAWNWRNDPRQFRTELEYSFDKLPSEGRTQNTPWTASYWPYYEDGINHRWQGKDQLSPAEKYDKAFNGWEPEEGFMDLKPFDIDTCEWDQAYYDGLGPAAAWTSANKGNAMSRNGRDDDGDGLSDAEECGAQADREDEKPNLKYDGVETWWGICHAWAPAALVEPEPLSAVTRNGVTFDVSDLKGLMIQQWDRASAFMMGGRCNEKEVERDEETGRITNPECRDLNAGAWHVIVTNFLGINQKGMVIERIFDYEIWNQPLFGYKIDSQREITLEEAHALLNVTTEDPDAGNGVVVADIEEESPRARALLDFVNGANDTQLREAGATRPAAAATVAHRNGPDGELGTADDNLFDSVQEVDDVRGVGPATIRKYAAAAVEAGLLPIEYAYNADAVKFIEIQMHTIWLTEQLQTATRTDEVIDRYTRNDHYHYILELDAEGNVIGGEWVGTSITAHPDFIWTPTRAVSGNPALDIDVVRDMILESRRNVMGDEGDETENLTVSSTDVVSIPDNDPKGAVSTITVEESGAIESIKLNLEIAHTYKGDLYVELRHGGIAVAVYDGQEESTPWADDVSISELEIKGFEGARVDGDWELVVFDSFRLDIGTIESWDLTFEVKR